MKTDARARCVEATGWHRGDLGRLAIALAVGNSRLALALSVAFVGPLLHLVGEESHGFHFSGGSSSGKTTALRVSSSAWGIPIHTWRTTDNAAEGLARAADAMAYMLGNGQEGADAQGLDQQAGGIVAPGLPLDWRSGIG